MWCDIYVGVVVRSLRASSGLSVASWAVAELRLGVNFTVGKKMCIVRCFKREARGRFDWIHISR